MHSVVQQEGAMSEFPLMLFTRKIFADLPGKEKQGKTGNWRRKELKLSKGSGKMEKLKRKKSS